MEREPWSAIGTLDDIMEAFKAYSKQLPKSRAYAYWEEMLLYSGIAIGAINSALSGLVGNRMYSSRTLDPRGFQVGNANNVTTRQEVTRWFVVGILFVLYIAQSATSGTNDWGGGTIDFGKVHHFVCDSTLHFTSDYTTVNFVALLILTAIMSFIILISYAVTPVLRYMISRNCSPFESNLSQAYVSQRLRLVLQLHRIVVEETNNVKFTKTLDSVPRLQKGAVSLAPKYGIKIRDDEDVDIREPENTPNKITAQIRNGHSKYYATAVNNNDNVVTGWKLRDIS